MIMTLSSPEQWAQHEFEFVQLGDRRRNQRLVQVAKHLVANPAGTLPQAFSSWAELKAAYRLFDHDGTTFKNVIGPHTERTRAACAESGAYLLIVSTSSLHFTTL